MPNWCDTTYKAVGTKEQVKKFYDIATKAWEGRSEKHPNADEGWLGTFVDILGGPEEAYARGWMQDEPYLNKDETECTIYCNTAWGEPNPWREFIESKIDGLKIYYVAIEPGCEVYISNDDEYEDKYYVDASPEQPDNPFMTEDEVCAFLEDYYQANANSIEDCYAAAEGINDNEDDDEFLYIHKMEVYND